MMEEHAQTYDCADGENLCHSVIIEVVFDTVI